MIVAAERNDCVETERLVAVLPIRNQSSDLAEKTMQIPVPMAQPAQGENFFAVSERQMSVVVAAVGAGNGEEPELPVRSTRLAYPPLSDGRYDSSVK